LKVDINKVSAFLTAGKALSDELYLVAPRMFEL